jgi:hypothetical protein
LLLWNLYNYYANNSHFCQPWAHVP